MTDTRLYTNITHDKLSNDHKPIMMPFDASAASDTLLGVKLLHVATAARKSQPVAGNSLG